jgi:hypothetical protein
MTGGVDVMSGGVVALVNNMALALMRCAAV